jgi:hypothetical protein
MKKIIALLTVAIFAISCSISQEYTFKKDYSGSYQLQFDISQLAEIGGEEDVEAETEDLFADMNLDSIADLYKNMEGISNVVVRSENNVLFVNYDFKDLEALNRSLENKNDDESFGMVNSGKFTQDKGTFTYAAGDMSALGDSDSLVEMLSFLDYNITMHFPNKVASTSNGTVLEDNKSIFLTGNFGEVAKQEKTIAVEVKF